jgi:hypothetical protein
VAELEDALAVVNARLAASNAKVTGAAPTGDSKSDDR